MATHKSALKKSKTDLVRRARNRAGKSKLRSALKEFRAIPMENNSEAIAKLPELFSLIDVSAKKGFIHKNAANRLKSQISKRSAAAPA